MTPADVPPLPEPFMQLMSQPVYDAWAAQMRAYALAACAERDERIKEIEDFMSEGEKLYHLERARAEAAEALLDRAEARAKDIEENLACVRDAARYRKTMKLINDIRAVCTAENLTKFAGLIDERLAAIEREVKP